MIKFEGESQWNIQGMVQVKLVYLVSVDSVHHEDPDLSLAVVERQAALFEEKLLRRITLHHYALVISACMLFCHQLKKESMSVVEHSVGTKLLS